MLFGEHNGHVLAIPQPAHAWIAGQLLRAWNETLPEPLLFAAEQHDIGWLEWEAAPSFNAATGRPHGFREIGPAQHAPMWIRGVDLALASWGRHVALLVSRHGGLIYRRFARPAPGSADARAVETYLADQGAREAVWLAEIGLDAGTAQRQSGLLAFVDALSLALCGDLKLPISLEAPAPDGAAVMFNVTRSATGAFHIAPWPFRGELVSINGEGRRLPDAGRFLDEADFRKRFGLLARDLFHAELRPA